MAIPYSELQKRNPSNIIELFQLQLIPAIHGVDTTYYFHNGVSEDENSNIIFNNIQYERMPIEADGFGLDAKTLPRPTLKISNILGTITTILLTLPQGLEGAKVTRFNTLERYIDDANFATGNILTQDTTVSNILQEDGDVIKLEEISNPHGTPDPTATFSNSIFFIDRKISENRQAVVFELAASFDVDGVLLPKRQVLPSDFPGIGTFYS